MFSNVSCTIATTLLSLVVVGLGQAPQALHSTSDTTSSGDSDASGSGDESEITGSTHSWGAPRYQSEPCTEYIPCGQTRTATAQGAESVMWTLEAKSTQLYRFSTCGSSSDTVMTVNGIEHDDDRCTGSGNYGETMEVLLFAGQQVAVIVRSYEPWTESNNISLEIGCLLHPLQVTSERISEREDICVDAVPCGVPLVRSVQLGSSLTFDLRAGATETYEFDFCDSIPLPSSIVVNDNRAYTLDCLPGHEHLTIPMQYGEIMNILVQIPSADIAAPGTLRMLALCSGVSPESPTAAPTNVPSTASPTTSPSLSPSSSPTTTAPSVSPSVSVPTSGPTLSPSTSSTTLTTTTLTTTTLTTTTTSTTTSTSSTDTTSSTTSSSTTTWLLSCEMHGDNRAACLSSSLNCTFSEDIRRCHNPAYPVQCADHDNCGVEEYCDRLYQCHMCFFCERFQDAVDNQPCPYKCRRITGSPSTVPTTTAPTTKSPTTASPTTGFPSELPSTAPSVAPTTTSPTEVDGTFAPSTSPSSSFPSRFPSEKPSEHPSERPSAKPSYGPTRAPSSRPTALPTSAPTSGPSHAPTTSPTLTPTMSVPTAAPSNRPSISPMSSAPSTYPSSDPTAEPTVLPIYLIARLPLAWDSLETNDRFSNSGSLTTALFDMLYNLLAPTDILSITMRNGMIVRETVSATIFFRDRATRDVVATALCQCRIFVIYQQRTIHPVLQSNFTRTCPDSCVSTTTTSTSTSSTTTSSSSSTRTITSSTLTITSTSATVTTSTTETTTSTATSVTSITSTTSTWTTSTETQTSSTRTSTTSTVTSDPCLVHKCSNNCTEPCGWGWNTREGIGDCRWGRVTTQAMRNLGNCSEDDRLTSQRVVEDEALAESSTFIVSLVILGMLILVVITVVAIVQRRMHASAVIGPKISAIIESRLSHQVPRGVPQRDEDGASRAIRQQLQAEHSARIGVLTKLGNRPSLAQELLSEHHTTQAVLLPGTVLDSSPSGDLKALHHENELKEVSNGVNIEPVAADPSDPSEQQEAGSDNFVRASSSKTSLSQLQVNDSRSPSRHDLGVDSTQQNQDSSSSPVHHEVSNIATKPSVNIDGVNTESTVDAPLWLHGPISKVEATELVSSAAEQIAGDGTGTFLVREVEAGSADYALCLLYKGKPTHHGISLHGEEWRVNRNFGQLSFVDSVEQFYEEVPGWPVVFSSPVPVKSGGVRPQRAVGTPDPKRSAEPLPRLSNKPSIKTEKTQKTLNSNTMGVSDSSAVHTDPLNKVHLHLESEKDAAFRMLQSSDETYKNGTFFVARHSKKECFVLNVNYKGPNMDTAKPTRHLIAPNQDGCLTINKKIYGHHRTLSGLLKYLSQEGEPAVRDGWPIALSDQICPPWLYVNTSGPMSRERSESLLRDQAGSFPNGKFLIREHETGGMVLSVNFKGKATHHRIETSAKGYEFWNIPPSQHLAEIVDALSRPDGERPVKVNSRGDAAEWPVRLHT